MEVGFVVLIAALSFFLFLLTCGDYFLEGPALLKASVLVKTIFDGVFLVLFLFLGFFFFLCFFPILAIAYACFAVTMRVLKKGYGA